MKNSHKLIFIFITSLFLLSTPSYGQKLFKRVDKDGNVSYHDESEKESGDNSKEIKPTIAPQAALQQPITAQENNNIIVYTIQSCEACTQVLDYFAKQGIEVEEQSINNREVQEKIFAEAGSLSVPSISIGDVLLTEINEDNLVSELKKAGYSIQALAGKSGPDTPIPEESEESEEDLSDEEPVSPFSKSAVDN